MSTVVSAQEDANLVQKALDDSTFNWKSCDSKGVRIYYQPGSFAEQHRAMILRSVTTTVDESLEFLGETKYHSTLHVFYVESREEMQRIVGRPYTGLANWTANGVFVVINPDWRSFEKHELTHVFTMELWGSPHAESSWMIEGIALCSDGWCREYAVDEIASYYLATEQLPPLRELFDNFRALGEIRGGVYAASIIGFIREEYGTDTLKQLWLEGSGVLNDLLGAGVDEVEDSWKAYLKLKVNKDVDVDLTVIDDLGCG
jgi:hypothetical protein